MWWGQDRSSQGALLKVAMLTGSQYGKLINNRPTLPLHRGMILKGGYDMVDSCTPTKNKRGAADAEQMKAAGEMALGTIQKLRNAKNSNFQTPPTLCNAW